MGLFVFVTFLSPTQGLQYMWGMVVETGKTSTHRLFFFSPAPHTVMGLARETLLMR